MHGSSVGSPRRSVLFRSNSAFDTASWSCLSGILPLDKTYLQADSGSAARAQSRFTRMCNNWEGVSPVPPLPLVTVQLLLGAKRGRTDGEPTPSVLPQRHLPGDESPRCRALRAPGSDRSPGSYWPNVENVSRHERLN